MYIVQLVPTRLCHRYSLKEQPLISDYTMNPWIFSSLLTVWDSFAKNLNLLVQKRKMIEIEYVQCLVYVGVF
jgi:hypothetical protein